MEALLREPLPDYTKIARKLEVSVTTVSQPRIGFEPANERLCNQLIARRLWV